MPAKYSSFKTISGDCEQCGDGWSFEGWDNGRWYKAYISGMKPKLCKQCLDARKWGERAGPCESDNWLSLARFWERTSTDDKVDTQSLQR